MRVKLYVVMNEDNQWMSERNDSTFDNKLKPKIFVNRSAADENAEWESPFRKGTFRVVQLIPSMQEV